MQLFSLFPDFKDAGKRIILVFSCVYIFIYPAAEQSGTGLLQRISSSTAAQKLKPYVPYIGAGVALASAAGVAAWWTLKQDDDSEVLGRIRQLHHSRGWFRYWRIGRLVSRMNDDARLEFAISPLGREIKNRLNHVVGNQMVQYAEVRDSLVLNQKFSEFADQNLREVSEDNKAILKNLYDFYVPLNNLNYGPSILDEKISQLSDAWKFELLSSRAHDFRNNDAKIVFKAGLLRFILSQNNLDHELCHRVKLYCMASDDIVPVLEKLLDEGMAPQIIGSDLIGYFKRVDDRSKRNRDSAFLQRKLEIDFKLNLQDCFINDFILVIKRHLSERFGICMFGENKEESISEGLSLLHKILSMQFTLKDITRPELKEVLMYIQISEPLLICFSRYSNFIPPILGSLINKMSGRLEDMLELAGLNRNQIFNNYHVVQSIHQYLTRRCIGNVTDAFLTKLHHFVRLSLLTKEYYAKKHLLKSYYETYLQILQANNYSIHARLNPNDPHDSRTILSEYILEFCDSTSFDKGSQIFAKPKNENEERSFEELFQHLSESDSFLHWFKEHQSNLEYRAMNIEIGRVFAPWFTNLPIDLRRGIYYQIKRLGMGEWLTQNQAWLAQEHAQFYQNIMQHKKWTEDYSERNETFFVPSKKLFNLSSEQKFKAKFELKHWFAYRLYLAGRNAKYMQSSLASLLLDSCDQNTSKSVVSSSVPNTGAAVIGVAEVTQPTRIAEIPSWASEGYDPREHPSMVEVMLRSYRFD